VEPPPELHRHLGSILASGVRGDVTFVVGKETFIAHKTVLAARSPVFMPELFGSMMEEKQAMARVRVLGIDARAFKAMLYFIYTNSLPEIDEGDKIVMAQHLLVAADRYDIQRLKRICENKLCMFVNYSIVATTLVLAEQHGYRRLKEACFKILKYRDNFKALGYDDYNYLKRSCPSLLEDFLAEHGL
jgi:speckle-type POZ protein